LGPDADVLRSVKTEVSIATNGSSTGHHSAIMSPTDELCNLSALIKMNSLVMHKYSIGQ